MAIISLIVAIIAVLIIECYAIRKVPELFKESPWMLALGYILIIDVSAVVIVISTKILQEVLLLINTILRENVEFVSSFKLKDVCVILILFAGSIIIFVGAAGCLKYMGKI